MLVNIDSRLLRTMPVASRTALLTAHDKAAATYLHLASVHLHHAARIAAERDKARTKPTTKGNRR